jgi:hypothetical protein
MKVLEIICLSFNFCLDTNLNNNNETNRIDEHNPELLHIHSFVILSIMEKSNSYFPLILNINNEPNND